MAIRVLLLLAASMVFGKCFAFDWDGEAYAKLEYAQSFTQDVPRSKKNNSNYIGDQYKRLCV